jgi:hypothetical protein
VALLGGGFSFAMYSGLVMLSTLVSYVYLGMCIIEMTSVVVRVNGESKSTRLPCYGAIEVRESDVLVVLPCIENIAEVSVAAIPPDSEYIGAAVEIHKIIEIYLIYTIVL